MRGIARAGCFVAVFAAAVEAGATDPTPLDEADLARNAGVVTIFVPPVYPKAALEAGIQGTVDVEGLVRPDGTFEIRTLDSSVDREDLRQAVREAARLWILQPRFEKDCTLGPTPGRVRVWFEIRGGEPVISFSAPVRQKDAKAEFDAGSRPISRRNPRYPRRAIEAGIASASVLAILRVGADGRVENVETVPNGAHRWFHDEVVKTLRTLKFPQRAAGLPALCLEYRMRFWLEP